MNNEMETNTTTKRVLITIHEAADDERAGAVNENSRRIEIALNGAHPWVRKHRGDKAHLKVLCQALAAHHLTSRVYGGEFECVLGRLLAEERSLEQVIAEMDFINEVESEKKHLEFLQRMGWGPFDEGERAELN